jgi:hypothetical protein
MNLENDHGSIPLPGGCRHLKRFQVAREGKVEG